ncbi:hypothetical protein AB4Y30_10735 [Ornithinibacillus sp. 4-3]|uniref:Uncharacterized protein n=1 Tax=Ornithinibacillus sp. 4-3 TaxID=3231488 RepID=A0AB39HK43_9BACI
MKKVILLLVTLSFIVAGCGSSDGDTEISGVINDHLGISPYIPETDYEIGIVILEYHPGFEDGDPRSVTVNYFEALEEIEPIDEDLKESWQESNPEGELIYGDLYMEPSVISLEIFPDGGLGELMDAETIEVAGHEIQYQFLEQGSDGRDSDTIFMNMHFDDMGYFVRYSVQSDDIEEAAKELAADIIENNS